MSVEGQRLEMRINGQAVAVDDVPADLSMVDFLHEYLNLTGTRMSCGQGVCHACVVIVDHADGRSDTMRTCITGAHFFHGKSIRTIEGHARLDERGGIVLDTLQQAFLDHFAFQCSYCTPGFVNAATVLLERLAREPVARDRVEEVLLAALDGHLCRCTGYVRYYEALRQVILTRPGLVRG